MPRRSSCDDVERLAVGGELGDRGRHLFGIHVLWGTSVELVSLDVLGDTVGDQIADRLPGGHPPADHGRGDAHPRHLEEPGPLAAGQRAPAPRRPPSGRCRGAWRWPGWPAPGPAPARATWAGRRRCRRRRSGRARCWALAMSAPPGYRPCTTVRRGAARGRRPRSARRPARPAGTAPAGARRPARPRRACAGGCGRGSASRGRARAHGTPPGRTRGDRDVAD